MKNLFFLIVVCFTFSAHAQNSKLEEASEAFNNNDFLKTVEIINNLLASSQQNEEKTFGSEVYVLLAQSYNELNNKIDLEKTIAIGLANFTNDKELVSLKVKQLINEEKIDEAFNFIETCLAKDSKNKDELLFIRAKLHIFNSDSKSAESTFREIILLYPEMTKAAVEFGFFSKEEADSLITQLDFEDTDEEKSKEIITEAVRLYKQATYVALNAMKYNNEQDMNDLAVVFESACDELDQLGIDTSNERASFESLK